MLGTRSAQGKKQLKTHAEQNLGTASWPPAKGDVGRQWYAAADIQHPISKSHFWEYPSKRARYYPNNIFTPSYENYRIIFRRGYPCVKAVLEQTDRAHKRKFTSNYSLAYDTTQRCELLSVESSGGPGTLGIRL